MTERLIYFNVTKIMPECNEKSLLVTIDIPLPTLRKKGSLALVTQIKKSFFLHCQQGYATAEKPHGRCVEHSLRVSNGGKH